jgi:hypothetical protein
MIDSEFIRKNRLRTGALVIELVALSIWVGTMIGFAFIFAPIAFHHIGNLSQFAALIGAVIRQIDVLGAYAGIVILTATFFSGRNRLRSTRQACVVAMLIGTGYEHFAIIPRMERALAAVPGSLTNLAANDPVRVGYDQLHHASSTLYGVVVILGVVTLALAAGLSGITEDTLTANAG